MSNKQTAIVTSNAKLTAQRNAKGRFEPGASGNPGGASRARRELNADTVREMHHAFRIGGREAIFKVMKSSPAIFLKLLVLLVPRELEVTHTGGVKAMTDEQLEAGIEAIQAMLAAREAGENARVINDIPDVIPQFLETRETSEPTPARTTRRKAKRDMDTSMGSEDDSVD